MKPACIIALLCTTLALSAEWGIRLDLNGMGNQIPLDPAPGEEVNLVDATGCGRIVLSLARAPREAAAFTATGVPAEIPTPGAGCRLLTMPVSGVLRLRF